ncbi:glycine N-acyltransferase-like protein 3 [Anolis carolinensis]|uniref:glycine N-acyltransferase-like protein 3 n=1 Tax=Anolis carolinensis TaxID=28377 RepID=UPI002F2B6CB8
MLILSFPSKLLLLEEILRKCLPQALVVHGAVMNINRGNPAGHEVIVDSWPNFKAVLTRPQREVVSDDSDFFANVYAAFYQDLALYQDLVLNTDAVNWMQRFRIQGNQDGIYRVSKLAAATKNVPLSATSYITYIHPDPNKLIEYQLDPGFTVSTLNASHVDLMDETWANGGSEQSHRYLASLVQHFFSSCILDPNGQPISWCIMNPFGAMGISYTLPAHRGKHYSAVAARALNMKAHTAGYPVYGHVAPSNAHSRRIQEHRGFQILPELCHICIHADVQI